MLSTKGPSGRSLAEEWFRLGVWISKQQSWTSAPYEPLQKAATGYGYKLLIPDYKMNYYSGDHKFDVYTSGLKPASSMKDAETKMRDYAYMTYAKFGGDKFTWEKSELSNDDRKQDILYMIVRATTNTGTWSSSNTVDLPPYTRVLLKTNTATETFHESWKAPMYLTYKVTLVDYSIDLEDNAKKHDHAQVITSFPNGRNGEPGDAVSAVKYCIDNRADFNDVNWNEIIRKSNSFEYHGVKGSIEPVINILNENISDAPHMENLTSTQKVINQSSGGLISLYPMKKIDIKKGSTEYTLTKGDFMYPSEIELEGRLDSEHQNALYQGFKQEEGYWILVDEHDKPIPADSPVARLEHDIQTGKQKLVAGNQAGKVFLKYIIDEDYYKNTSYVGDREGAHITNASITTIRIPVTIQEEAKVGWTIQLSGNQTLAAGDPAVAPDLTVKVYNQAGRQVNYPVHWYAKDLNTLDVVGDTFAAPADLKPGKYTVAAYLGSNPDAPDTYTEHEIEVKAPRTLGSLTAIENVTLEPKVQTLNLNTLEVQKFDQYKGTDLDKAVNPKAAAASADYKDDAQIVWTANDKNVVIKDGVAQFPAQNGTYTLIATCGDIKSNPVAVTVTGFVSFPDVKPDDWFYNGVMYSVGKGFISGLPDGTFGPSVTMTRAQLVQMLYAFEGKPDVAVTDKFSDVKTGDWFAKAVSWAVDKGITSGVGDGTTFAPNNQITRQEMAVMLHAFEGRVPAETQLKFVDNAEIASWAAPSVQWAVSSGLMGSTSTNPAEKKFSPKATATRAEAATIMMNLDLMGR